MLHFRKNGNSIFRFNHKKRPFERFCFQYDSIMNEVIRKIKRCKKNLEHKKFSKTFRKKNLFQLSLFSQTANALELAVNKSDSFLRCCCIFYWWFFLNHLVCIRLSYNKFGMYFTFVNKACISLGSFILFMDSWIITNATMHSLFSSPLPSPDLAGPHSLGSLRSCWLIQWFF